MVDNILQLKVYMVRAGLFMSHQPIRCYDSRQPWSSFRVEFTPLTKVAKEKSAN